MGKMWRALLAAIACLALLGCPRPAVLANASGDATIFAQNTPAPAIHGRVEHASMRVQSTISDIAVGATVSLIDTGTNNTVGATVTDANGAFVLTFSNSYRPVAGRTYYLEAFKGLPVGGQPNRAGAPAARVRTLLRWGTSWSAVDPSFTISRATTAVSVISSLRSGTATPVDPAGLMNTVSGTSFTAGTTGISNTEFNNVYTLVDTALTLDTDPLYYVGYDSSSSTYLPKPLGVAITSITPASGSIGATITISGTNLSSVPIVRFNGVAGSNTIVNGAQVQLTTQVPVGATSGPLTIQVGTIIYGGFNFAVTTWDGHNVYDTLGNLYVASYYTNQVMKVAPDGTLTVFATGPLLSGPAGIAVDPANNVYVSCYNNSTIVKITPQGAMTLFASGGNLSGPQRLAVDSAGNLYVGNYTGGSSRSVLKYDPTGATSTVYGTGVGYAGCLAFAPDGSLWVTDSGNNSICKIPPGGGAAQVLLTAGATNNVINAPCGLCFDSTGNAYEANNNNSVILKVDSQGNWKTFTYGLTNCRSMAMRTDGVLVYSSFTNILAYINAQAQAVQVVQGGSYDWDITMDSGRNLYMTTSDIDNYGIYTWNHAASVYESLYNSASDSYGISKPIVTSGLNKPDAVRIAANNDLYVGDWDDGIYRVPAGSSTAYKYAQGTGRVAGLAFDSSNRLYAASWTYHGIYRFNNGAVDQQYGFAWTFYGVARDAAGTMYTSDYNGNRIFKVTPAGDMSVYATGVSGPVQLTIGPDGALYVVQYSAKQVLRIDPTTQAQTVYATGINSAWGLAFDGNGVLYVSDYSDGIIYSVASASATPQVYAKNMSSLQGVATDPAGNVYATSWNNKCIYKIPASSSAPYDATNAAWVTGLPDYPMCVAYNPASGQMVFDLYNYRWVLTAATSGGAYGTSAVTAFTTNPNATRNWGQMLGICCSATGDIYVSDVYPTIYKLAGNQFNLVAQMPISPISLCMDPSSQNLYVGDWDSQSVYRINLTTGATRVIKDWTYRVKGLAFDPNGKLYAQPWGGATYQFADPTSTDSWTVYNSTNEGLGSIVFDSTGQMFSPSSGWFDTVHGNVVKTPVGGGAASSVWVWYHDGLF